MRGGGLLDDIQKLIPDLYKKLTNEQKIVIQARESEYNGFDDTTKNNMLIFIDKHGLDEYNILTKEAKLNMPKTLKNYEGYWEYRQ